MYAAHASPELCSPLPTGSLWPLQAAEGLTITDVSACACLGVKIRALGVCLQVRGQTRHGALCPLSFLTPYVQGPSPPNTACCLLFLTSVPGRN